MNSGDRLGHYEIVGHLGSGGMGEVYRARDMNLEREVAIKVLPSELSTDTERLARFEREARLLAQFDHPNIAAIHGLERDGETTFLVMQLASGETLGERVGGAPMDPADAIPIARQIAEGMEAAHDRGIIHRDLKPANIMVAADGSVKILDFGLAKALDGTGGGGAGSIELSASPTMMAGTMAGMILGTAAYMSPEQARGLVVDRRADIWAFGCVLFEMLTGRQPFVGGTVTDVLATIVKEDPDWDALPASIPATLRALLNRCLDKDPRQRLRDIGEARIALADGAATAEPAMAASTTNAGAGANPGLLALIVLGPLIAAGLTWAMTRSEPAATPLLRGAVDLPAGMSLNLEGDNAGPPVLAPDGTKIVFSAATPADGLRLWVRDLDDPRPRPLDGTSGGYFPWWSPDSRSIAFFAQDRLLRIDIGTGQVITVTDGIELGRSGLWHPDGTLYYSPSSLSSLHAVDSSGTSAPVAWPIDAELHTTQRWSQLLPGGEHILYLASSHYAPEAETNGIWVARRDGSDPKQLLSSDSSALYAAGHLLFVRESTLLAQPFDVDSLELRGAPRPVGDSVTVDVSTWKSLFTASEDGTLIYLPAGEPLGRVLRWVDRRGEALDVWQPPGNYQTVRLSPGDSRLAAEFQQLPVSQLYLYGMDGRREQLTFSQGDNAEPMFSEDGAYLYHAKQALGANYSVARTSTTGGTTEQVFEIEGVDVWPYDLSAEAGAVFVGSGNYFQRTIRADMWAVPLDGGDAYRFLDEDGWEPLEVAVSYDGRSVAFAAIVRGSDETQIYVAPLETVGGRLRVGEPRRQISADGGFQPRWRGDDGELFFLQGAGQVTASTLQRGPRGEVTRFDDPEVLFSAVLAYGPGLGYGFDVTEDGQRFVILETDTRARQLALVSDWRLALESASR